ncbi:MAG: hypothetical protein R2728_08365, partial [Chitinophagales bacterium]
MIKKTIKYLAYSVVFISALCIYSWMIYHSSTGGTKLDFIKTPLLKFAGFPQQVQEVLTSSEV